MAVAVTSGRAGDGARVVFGGDRGWVADRRAARDRAGVQGSGRGCGQRQGWAVALVLLAGLLVAVAAHVLLWVLAGGLALGAVVGAHRRERMSHEQRVAVVVRTVQRQMGLVR